MAIDLTDLPLTDHHCHVLVRGELDRAGLESRLSEGGAPPAGATRFDTALGLAVRRHCAPLLDLPAHADPETYCARRAELGAEETARRLLAAARIDRFLVDTGIPGDDLGSMGDLARVSGGTTHEVVRLEQVAEDFAARGVDASEFARDLAAEVERVVRERGAVAVKSVAAYRIGLDFDPSRPSAAEVERAAQQWISGIEPGVRPRMDDPVLIRHLVWTAVDLGLPIQWHIGYGDSDVRLHRTDPSLLTDFLHLAPPSVPIMLLHCYPFHRQAGYLAACYPNVHLDVGLTLSYLGPTRAEATLAEVFELAPFDKVLFSTDAFALPELYHLGALSFRRGLEQLLDRYVESGEWAATDARRVAELVGHRNAARVYGLPESEA